MPTPLSLEVPGATGVVFRPPVSGYSGQARGVVQINSDGAEVGIAGNPQQVSQAAAGTAGGTAPYSKMATADTNAAVIKAAPGRIYGYQIFNNTTTAKYVRLYNKASVPVPATDAALIVRRMIVPASGVVAFHVGQGLGGFTAGIGIAATGAAGDSDATALAANDLVMNVDYA